MSDERTVILGADEVIKVGTQLNHMYEIESHIASGGMGEVYKGHELGTGEKVAIKIVLPSLARDPSMMALFVKEASVLRRLSDDAIVRYLSFALDREVNRHFIAMEFVDGESLARRVETRGPLSPEEARRLMLRVAAGLAAAHEAGIVHRDLSPDNIILPDGRVDKCKIIDFGIAKAGDIGGKTVIDGRFAGKVNFVSPEQLGLYGPVTGKSDIYSLGLAMAMALLGEPLDMGGLPAQAAEKRRAVPDLSGIDPELAGVLAAMLQPQPAERPDSGEIAEWLREMNRAHAPTRAPAAGRSTLAAPPISASSAPPFQGSQPPPAGSQPPLPLAGSWPSQAGSAAPYSPSQAPVYPAGPPPGLSGSQAPAAGASRSPFGPLPAGYGPGQPSPVFGPPPGLGSQPPLAPPPVARRGGGGLFALLLMLLAAAGAAGAYFGGVFDKPAPKIAENPVPPKAPEAPSKPPGGESGPKQPPAPPENKPAAPDPPPVSKPKPPQPLPQPIDRVQAILAAVKGFDGGPCTHASVTAVSDKSAAVTGFAQTDKPFNGLLAAIHAAANIDPTISVRAVNQRQCPVIDFLKASAGTPSPPLTLDRDLLEISKGLSGRAEVPDNAAVNLLYVDQDGFVQNMKALVRNSKPGERSFAFKLASRKPEAEPQPQLIVLLTSKAGVPAADIRNPEKAADLFPKILAATRDGKVLTGVSVAYFKIVPKT